MELRMKAIAITFLLIIVAHGCSAQARSLIVYARSGQPKLVYVYMSWHKDCSPRGGIVKVLTKPQHGTLRPRHVNRPIGRGRYDGATACFGKPGKGFEVWYQSSAGYRGQDTFSIEVDYKFRPPDLDEFIVIVE